MKNYTGEQLRALLKELLTYPTELPWLEWKHSNDEPETIGKYVSALANSACAENRGFGYMIWGIDDATRTIIGTPFNPDTRKKGNQFLKIYLKMNLSSEVSFDFYRFEVDGKSVVLLEIEAAYRQPVSMLGKSYVRVGESLTDLKNEPVIAAKIYRSVGKDWSAEIVIGATISDLSEDAIIIARKNIQKNTAMIPLPKTSLNGARKNF